MLDITKLWDITYLFGPNPVEMSRSDFVFFGLALGLLVFAIIFKLVVLWSETGSPKRYLFNRYFHLALTMGILMVLWVGGRWQNIPWLSAHIVVLTLWLAFLIWLSFIVWYQIKKYREQRSIWEEERTKREYLGQRK